jgi:U3 small nucleolar RNA-associated protein 6
MAGVAEKARFYLERSVSQLREWEEKGIFSKVRSSRQISSPDAYSH